MSTYSTAARNAARDAISALLTAGSTVTYPSIRFRTAADAELLTINLDATTPIGAASSGVATVAAPQGEGSWSGYAPSPSANGTCAKVVFCDKDENVVETCSVGTTGSGEEFELTTLDLLTTTPVTFSAAPTLTQRASYDPTP